MLTQETSDRVLDDGPGLLHFHALAGSRRIAAGMAKTYLGMAFFTRSRSK